MPKRDVVIVLEFDDRGSAKVKKVTAEVVKSLQRTEKGAQKAGKGFNAMNKQVKNAEKGQSKFRKMLKRTWAQMTMGMGLMTGISGALRMVSRGISSVMKTGRDFERTWANVTTMINDADVNVNKFRERLVEMSPILGSTIDLGKGLYQVLSASISPARDGAIAIEFLGVAAKAAQAGLTDTFTAVDALTTVMNAYRMETHEAMKVSDIMFKTVMRGKLTYEGMASTLGTVVPMAAQVGIKFEEVAAAMATLTRQGIAVNTTTVQLRQIMVSVLKPTAEAEKAAERLGINFDAATLKAKGLAGFLEYVTEAVKGDAEAMTDFFGNVRALTGAFALAGKAADGFRKDQAFMKEEIAATEIAFKKQMASTDFWMKTMANVFEKLRLAIYDGLMEPFKQGIKDSKSMEEKIKDLTKKLTEFGRGVGLTIGKAIKFLTKLKDTLIAATKIMITFLAVKRIRAWMKAWEMAMYSSTVKTLLYRKSVESAALAVKGLSVALAIAAAAFIGWKIGKWISKVTGLTKHMMDLSYAVDNAGNAASNNIANQQKLRDMIAGTGLTVLKLKDKYGSYGLAVTALMKKDKDYFKTLREKQKLQTDEGKAILKVIDIFRKQVSSGKWASDKIKEFYKGIEEQAEELGIEVPKDLKKLRDEGVLLADSAKKIKDAWEGALKGFRDQAPTVEGLEHSYKALNTVMEDLQVEGWASDDALLHYGDTLKSLWDKAQPIIHLLDEDFKNALKADIERFEELNEKTQEYVKAGMNPFLMMAERVVKAIDKKREAANLLGTTWSQDLIKRAQDMKAAFDEVRNSTEWSTKSDKEKTKIIVGLVEAMKDAGMKIPAEYQEIYDAAKKSAEGTDVVWANVAQNIVSYWTQGMAEMIAGTSSFADMVSNTFNLVANSISNVIGGSIEKTLGKMTGTIGALAGPIGGMIGGLANIAFSGLKKLFGIKSKAEKEAEARKKEEEAMKKRIIGLQNEFSKFGKISESLAKRIMELRKEHGRYTGTLMALGDVMRDTGITMKNVAQYGQELERNLGLISRGMIDTAVGTEALGEAFSEFIQGVERLGKEGSRYVVEFLQRVRELGQEIEEVNEYVFGWLEKGASGMKSMTEAAGDNIEALQRMSNLASVTFDALIEQGMSYTEALITMAEPLELLAEKFDELGISGGEAFDRLMQMVQVRKENEALFAAIDANNQLLQALGNTGFLTSDALQDVAANAQEYYNQLEAAGLSAQDALAVMAPSLERLAYYAEQYGFELGQATQELVNQAREAGLLSEVAESELHREVDRIVDGLEGIEEAIRGREAPIEAQHGFHGTVTGPQDFRVEPGVTERVDITPVGEVGEQAPVIINPIALPLPDMDGYLIKFIQEGTKDELVAVHVNAVKEY